MSTINVIPRQSFTEVLASSMAVHAREAGKTAAPAQQTAGQNLQGTELLNRQQTVNETFWNMLAVGNGVMVDESSKFKADVLATTATKAAEVAMRLRLVSAYGAATTEAMVGRKNPAEETHTQPVRMRNVTSSADKPSAVPPQNDFSLAA